jgi:hypothetical protein
MVRQGLVKGIAVDGGPRNLRHEQHRWRNQHGVIEVSHQFTDVILCARSICKREKVEQLDEHATVAFDVRIPSDDRQHTAEQDAYMKDARQRQATVVLSRFALHPGLLRFGAEFASETESERPVLWASHYPHEP